MSIVMNTSTAWINISSGCNLDCTFCYSQGTDGSQMLLKTYRNLLNALKQIKTEHLVLIGGEPTIHKDFYEFLDSAILGFEVSIVTNALRFAEKDFWYRFRNYKKIRNISISVKGYDAMSFHLTTQTQKFDDFLKAQERIRHSNFAVSYSYVYSNKRQINMEAFVDFIEKNKIYPIIISDARPYIIAEDKIENKETTPVLFEEFILFLISKNINFQVRLNRPFCHYSTSFIDSIKNQRVVISSCILRDGGGLFFDVEANQILCNEFFNIILNQKDVVLNGNESRRFKQKSELYSPLGNMSSKRCKECRHKSNCNGGCILFWI